MDISIEKPPPKPPHNSVTQLQAQNSTIISPMTNLANSFRGLSSSANDTSTQTLTPARVSMKLSFNSSGENMVDQDDDHAIDLQPAKSYSSNEANLILNSASKEDTNRFAQQPTRRALFTKSEQKFNALRRLNSCGSQLPRQDEKSVGRQRRPYKTVDEVRRKAVIFENDEEEETDRLFEIAIRSRSCSRHRSDSITPLRKHSSARSNALEPDDISPPCSPLRLNNSTSTRPNDETFDEFFERFSDDGFMEDDEEVEADTQETVTSEANQVTSTPTRSSQTDQQNQPTLPNTSIEISPLVAPLLARHRSLGGKTPTRKLHKSPLNMDKLLNGAISKPNTRRGLFKDEKSTAPKSILKQVGTPSPRGRKQKRKFTQISDSPVKRFASPDTPSKIRCRRRKLSFSRAKSVTYNVTALRQVTNMIQSKNYRCSTNADEQEKVKRSLDRVASCDDTAYSGNHTVRKLEVETCSGNGKHPQLTNISSCTLAKLLRQDDSPVKYDIVDCRYPYEYNGGRIGRAINVSTEVQLYDRYFSPEKSDYQYPPNDTVLIFHCEFSSERAPKMMKLIREIDRKEHKYPNLKYPELYLLKGGYKEFYAKFPELCKDGYVPMLDAAHKQDFDNFRRMREKSKTWSSVNRPPPKLPTRKLF